MKRTFAALMIIMMLCFACAYAETADTTEAAEATAEATAEAAETTETTETTETAIPEIVFDETTAAYEGTWVTFEDDGFMIYLPSDWIEAEITDEMLESGTYYAATSADGVYAMTVNYAETDVTTGEEIAAQLTEAGYENVTRVLINGIDVVGYDITDQDVSGMAFADAEGGMYVFSFTPTSDEAFAAIGQTIISSLSLIEAETDTAE
jgi:hypothetical protein